MYDEYEYGWSVFSEIMGLQAGGGRGWDKGMGAIFIHVV